MPCPERERVDSYRRLANLNIAATGGLFYKTRSKDSLRPEKAVLKALLPTASSISCLKFSHDSHGQYSR